MIELKWARSEVGSSVKQLLSSGEIKEVKMV